VELSPPVSPLVELPDSLQVRDVELRMRMDTGRACVQAMAGRWVSNSSSRQATQSDKAHALSKQNTHMRLLIPLVAVDEAGGKLVAACGD